MRILETARLSLRTIGPDDAAFYFELVSDPTWIEHIGDKGIRSVDGARTAILEGPCVMQERLGHSLYVIERKSDGKPLGLCGLIKRDSLPEVDIGYAIRPAYFGQGYTYEAAHAVMTYARDVLGIKRLMGITSPANTVSINLLAKLGLTFVEHKVLPPDGRPTNIYSRELLSPPQAV
jgi:RimJ/RimL family protein N-acetyltransferase